MPTSSPSLNSLGPVAPSPDWITLVREKVEGLRSGVVQLVVHDGRVTQIERTEKRVFRPRHTTQAAFKEFPPTGTGQRLH